MPLKMVCSDIDGTLVTNSHGKLSEEVCGQIRTLREHGILFCPTSGRQYVNLRRLFDPVAEYCTFICLNGGAVFQDEQCIMTNAMPYSMAMDIAHDLWDTSNGEGEVMLSGAEREYLWCRGLGLLDHERDLHNNYVVVQRPEEIQDDIVKVSVYLPKGAAPYAEQFVPRWPQANCAVAGTWWIDTTAANKGIALQALCRKLGISPADVMAFGDNFNDTAMLDLVGTPYIMDRAAPALRERYPLHTARPEDVLRQVLKEL